MSIIKLTSQSKLCVNLRNLCGVVSLLTLVSCSNSGDKQEVDTMKSEMKKIAVTASDVASQQWYDSTKKLNHLAGESSPYLLGHADNPVNWYPWDDEALQKAKNENKPIFLSVGYASCHWCHVMEHESFEDDSVAAYLNEHYIAIKVDREQRPDIDQIYMTAVSVFSGSGGWPMSVFLTPDLKPFFAGTYYPREDNPTYGLPGFLTLLKRLNDVYVNHRDKLDEQAEALTKAVKVRLAPEFEKTKLSHEIFDSAIAQSVQSMDSAYGGFGTGQKFPHSTELKALIRYVAVTDDSDVKTLLSKSLDALIRFGMYDQVGGGFHRYTVDRQFAVPHFEKMLYDNALLASVLVDAALVFDNKEYRDAAIATVDFMLREMTSEEGSLYSALDADSEGHEGKFYVWTKAEIDAALGNDAEFYYQYYNVTDIGNFELNTNVLARKPGAWQHLMSSSDRESIINRIDGINAQLLRKKSERQRPLTDDKIIAAWNGMALSAICNVYQLTGDERYLSAATKLGEFLTSKMLSGETLHHTYRNGTFSVGVYLEDYAYVSNGLVDLYESSGEFKWLEFANSLVTTGFKKFSDDKGSLYMSQANDNSSLARPRDFFDSSYPAPGSFLMLAAQRLSALTDNRELSGRVAKSLDALSGIMKEAPVALMSAVLVYHNQVIPRAEFAVIGSKASRDPFLRVVFTTYAPNRVIAFANKADERVALLAGKKSTESATGYVCRNYACKLPSETPEEFAKQIAGLTYAIAD